MKTLILSLLLVSGLQSFAAPKVLESWHLPSAKNAEYPDLLIKVLSDGNCISESDNFDGTKDSLTIDCKVGQSSWTSKGVVSHGWCSDGGESDDGPENNKIERKGNDLYFFVENLMTMHFVKATPKVLKHYSNLKPCSK